MKQVLSLIVKTHSVGYKSQAETPVEVAFHLETVPNDLLPDLLGDTVDVVVFDRFEVGGLALLDAEYNSTLPSNSSLRNGATKHLQGLVSEYIRTGDTLTKGAGLLGKMQLCYVPGTEAYIEMRRLEAWSKARIRSVSHSNQSAEASEFWGGISGGSK